MLITSLKIAAAYLLLLLCWHGVTAQTPPEPTAEEIEKYVEEKRAEHDRFADLVRKSSLICIGRVTTDGINSSLGCAGMHIRVSVEKVLKGDTSHSGSDVSAYYGGTYYMGEDEEDSIRAQAPEGRFIVFLKPSPYDSPFTVSDAYFGVLPYSSTAAVAIRHVSEDDDRKE